MNRIPRHRRTRERRLWRHTVAAGAAATTMAIGAPAAFGIPVAAAGTPVSRSPRAADGTMAAAPVKQVPTAVRRQVQEYLAGQEGRSAVAVLDRVTGALLVVHGHQRFRTASVVKLDILAALLLRQQSAGTELTESQKALATRMITRSDNAAADTLWREIGGTDGLAAANRTLGLTETIPGQGEHWGSTTTTVTDQLRLLRAVTDPEGLFDATERDYVLDLMSQVVAGQTWGVPDAATDEATGVYVKNGWVPVVADGNRWTVNSIGRIIEPDHDWLVVVLSDRHASYSSGVAMVTRASNFSVSTLREV